MTARKRRQRRAGDVHLTDPDRLPLKLPMCGYAPPDASLTREGDAVTCPECLPYVASGWAD